MRLPFSVLKTTKTKNAPLAQVRLLEGSLFKERQETHRRYLLSIEPDRMLAPFRIQAGLKAKAERYGGWESRDISGHTLGHFLSALSFLYAATGEEQARARAHYLVEELEACQSANGDGYVLPVEKRAFLELREGKLNATPFSLNGVWVPFYTLHKVMAGLRDAFHQVGIAKALELERKIADWLFETLKGLAPLGVQQMLQTEHGGMNEVLADLAADSGDDRYLQMASRFFHHQGVLEPMLRGEDKLNGLHGNTQIPKVVGLAREYELSDDPGSRERYRLAATSFWDAVVHRRSYAIGGHGESEHFFPVDQFPQRLTPNTCETCNTYNMLKLTSHLFAWEPQAEHMDFVERAMMNHLASNIGREPGEFGYFLGLGSVGVKVFSTPYDSWWCCVGTGLENPVRYGEQIYSLSAEALWINLYIASELNSSEEGIELRQETRFPEEETVRITLGMTKRLALNLRHPWWCAGLELKLNGERMETESRPSTYLKLERDWTAGDVLEIRLPMALHLEPLPQSENKILAVMHGPTVLAAIVPEEPGIANPSKKRFSEHLNARGKTDAFPPIFVAGGQNEVLAGLRPVENAFGEFVSQGIVKPHDLRFVPFHRIYEEQYAVYFPLLAPSEWGRREGEIRAQREEQRRIEAGTLDTITPGYQQPEVEHALACVKSEIEEFSDRKSRVAKDGGWFSYEIAVDPEDAMALLVTYWGGVWHERQFDLLIDGEKIARQKLLTNRPGDFFEQVYEIPPELTHGKKKVVLRFQSGPRNTAGGVFGIRMMKKSAVPAQCYAPTIEFKAH